MALRGTVIITVNTIKENMFVIYYKIYLKLVYTNIYIMHTQYICLKDLKYSNFHFFCPYIFEMPHPPCEGFHSWSALPNFNCPEALSILLLYFVGELLHRHSKHVGISGGVLLGRKDIANGSSLLASLPAQIPLLHLCSSISPVAGLSLYWRSYDLLPDKIGQSIH